MTERIVEVIIPVHDPARPVERAARSALAGGLRSGELRVTIVAHDVAARAIRSVLTPAVADSVRIIDHADGIRSPAGPFNAGLRAADARFIAKLDSDDFLEPGALRAWVDAASRDGLDAVVAPERHAAGPIVRTPPVRRPRRRLLDGVNDRLAYRTAPFGLISTETIQRLGLRSVEGLPTGEDQLFSAKLWFSDARIGFPASAPFYVVGDDAAERTTGALRSVADELRFASLLVDDEWFRAQPAATRRALVVKIVRVHVFAAIARRFEADAWNEPARADLSHLIDALARAVPDYSDRLSRADVRALSALLDYPAARSELRGLVAQRRRFGTPSTVLTPGLSSVFASDAPLRLMLASALMAPRAGGPSAGRPQ